MAPIFTPRHKTPWPWLPKIESTKMASTDITNKVRRLLYSRYASFLQSGHLANSLQSNLLQLDEPLKIAAILGIFRATRISAGEKPRTSVIFINKTGSDKTGSD